MVVDWHVAVNIRNMLLSKACTFSSPFNLGKRCMVLCHLVVLQGCPESFLLGHRSCASNPLLEKEDTQLVHLLAIPAIESITHL
jgi:hypothetical protein